MVSISEHDEEGKGTSVGRIGSEEHSKIATRREETGSYHEVLERILPIKERTIS